ncbi:polysaccharide pyruvyl transferase family protein [Planctomicrobium sp. SH664]|uniref:polysaccharide pyruvyl transferase family protein n=1 Tax=Planctomicrobium sp. SH664 TaxID=3448125 RepID=UPI003F5BF516
MSSVTPLVQSPISRRSFLKSSLAGTSMAALAARGAFAAPGSGLNPTILLLSGGQTANIGDVAHAPGMLRQLELSIPNANVILWKISPLDGGVEPMLRRNFPKLRIAETPEGPTLEEAFREADFMLRGSGPSFMSQSLVKWRKKTGKPYGAIGCTYSPLEASEEERDVMSHASFLFTRETESLKNLKTVGIDCPIMEFAPDTTFAFHLQNEAAAEEFLRQNGLEEGKFICVVPRLRVTPYYKIYPKQKGWTAERREEVDTLNAKWAEPDHAKAREAMIRWVRETGNKVLVCPEMSYQLDIMDELLINPLPDDVKKNVVKRSTYWLPDEAASTYKRACCVLSFECHSPIISLTVGTPTFYLRQPQDTIKGQMYYDIGLPKWVFEIEETNGGQIADRLMEVAGDKAAAQAYAHAAMQKATNRLEASMSALSQALKS